MTNFKARIAFPVWVFKLSRDSKGFEGKEFIVFLIVSVAICKPSTWANQRWVHREVHIPPNTLLRVLGCPAQPELNQNYGVCCKFHQLCFGFCFIPSPREPCWCSPKLLAHGISCIWLQNAPSPRHDHFTSGWLPWFLCCPVHFHHAVSLTLEQMLRICAELCSASASSTS